MSSIQILNKQFPTAVVVLLLLIAGAGAAAGASMAGSINGEMTTNVEQALVVDTDTPGAVIDKNGMVNVNDEGTEFRTTAEIWQGDNYPIILNLSYNGQTEINAELTLDIPDGLTVDVVKANEISTNKTVITELDTAAAENVTIGQVAEDRWLLSIDDETALSEHDGFSFQLGVEIRTENQIEPGFYTVEGQLFPVDV